MMLDTNIVSALMHEPGGTLARRIGEIAEAVSVSVVVAAELRYRAARRGSARLTTAVEAILGAIDIEPFAAPADLVYAHPRYRLEREGRPLGGNDLLIAAHALTLEGGIARHRRPGVRACSGLARRELARVTAFGISSTNNLCADHRFYSRHPG